MSELEVIRLLELALALTSGMFIGLLAMAINYGMAGRILSYYKNRTPKEMATRRNPDKY